MQLRKQCSITTFCEAEHKHPPSPGREGDNTANSHQWLKSWNDWRPHFCITAFALFCAS